MTRPPAHMERLHSLIVFLGTRGLQKHKADTLSCCQFAHPPDTDGCEHLFDLVQYSLSFFGSEMAHCVQKIVVNAVCQLLVLNR